MTYIGTLAKMISGVADFLHTRSTEHHGLLRVGACVAWRPYGP